MLERNAAAGIARWSALVSGSSTLKTCTHDAFYSCRTSSNNSVAEAGMALWSAYAGKLNVRNSHRCCFFRRIVRNCSSPGDRSYGRHKCSYSKTSPFST